MISTKLCIDNGRPITLMPCKLPRYILIKCPYVHPVDWETYNARVISNNFVLRNEVASFDTPADSARDPCLRVHHSRFVVYRWLLWVHLIGQEARECWLIYASFRVLESCV